MEKFSFYDLDRPKILAMDLDGTLLNYHGFMSRHEFGEPLRGMIEELIILRDAEVKLVVWTCRVDTPELRDHLGANEVPYDYVNDHPWNGPDNPRKIHADWYLDDKNVVFDGIVRGLADRILSHTPWWKRMPW
ncbi:MAG: hypothetical protein ACFFFC_00510 [Candidatus Thorarchaeota archaeon]